jgi:hypothetical protein
MLKAGLAQESLSSPAPMADRSEDPSKLQHVALIECLRPLNQNAVGSDGIRGRCGFPETTGGGMPQR